MDMPIQKGQQVILFPRTTVIHCQCLCIIFCRNGYGSGKLKVFSTTSPCWRLRENQFHWTWTNVVNMLSILLCLSDCSLAYISYENIWKELTKGLALPLFAFSAIVSGPFIIYQTNTNDELLSASENTRA